MAPPGGPRPGWSRRAQYGLFFSFLAAILGLLVGLIMLGLSLVAPKSYASVRGVALDATAPATGALRGVTATVAGVFTGAGNYWDAASQNARLKAERRLMLQRIIEARAVLLENRELKAALQLRERSNQTVATGRIVGSSFSSPRRYAILSAGGSDGVRVGMPVRSSDGLIGRVIDSGSLASRVLLVSDRASVIPTKLLRNGQPVISQGRGDGTVDLRPLEVGRNPFQKGDIVITSGTGGLYPPLVPVARVIRLDDDGAIAVPVADPGRTSFALVQPPYEPAAVAEESAEAPAEAP
jgi:rod shape-determining protein MreC